MSRYAGKVTIAIAVDVRETGDDPFGVACDPKYAAASFDQRRLVVEHDIAERLRAVVRAADRPVAEVDGVIVRITRDGDNYHPGDAVPDGTRYVLIAIDRVVTEYYEANMTVSHIPVGYIVAPAA